MGRIANVPARSDRNFGKTVWMGDFICGNPFSPSQRTLSKCGPRSCGGAARRAEGLPEGELSRGQQESFGESGIECVTHSLLNGGAFGGSSCTHCVREENGHFGFLGILSQGNST